MPEIKIIHGDCLEIMPTLADKSIDMILCDLPYGTTACTSIAEGIMLIHQIYY